MKWGTTKIWLTGSLKSRMQFLQWGKAPLTSLACPNKKTSVKSMLDSNTRKSYANKLKNKNRGKKFSKDRLKSKMSKTSSGIFKNDRDLPVEKDRKLNKRAAKLTKKNRNVRSEEINSNQVKKILLLNRNFSRQWLSCFRTLLQIQLKS